MAGRANNSSSSNLVAQAVLKCPAIVLGQVVLARVVLVIMDLQFVGSALVILWTRPFPDKAQLVVPRAASKVVTGWAPMRSAMANRQTAPQTAARILKKGIEFMALARI